MSDSDQTMGHVTVADPVPSMDPVALQPVSTVLPIPELPRLRAVEEWARMKQIAPWLIAAAVVGARWQVGPEFEPCMVTEEAFDRAVAFADNPCRAVNSPKKK